MKKNDDLKSIVRDKYATIALNSMAVEKEDCGCGCCGEPQSGFQIMKDDYDDVKGYVADADLGLGCGLPTHYAHINEGDTVVDLGSGAGNDVFVARSIVGEKGRVIGVDMTEEMVKKAVENNSKLGFENVEFKLGDIEDLPIEDNSVDVVVSNCVLNLVPDKYKAFKEIYRILKSGGHFCVSDIVTKGEIPDDIKHSAALYVGCVSGALEDEKYLEIIENTGFKNPVVHERKEIYLSRDLLKEFLNDHQTDEVLKSKFRIYSLTVSGYKL